VLKYIATIIPPPSRGYPTAFQHAGWPKLTSICWKNVQSRGVEGMGKVGMGGGGGLECCDNFCSAIMATPTAMTTIDDTSQKANALQINAALSYTEI